MQKAKPFELSSQADDDRPAGSQSNGDARPTDSTVARVSNRNESPQPQIPATEPPAQRSEAGRSRLRGSRRLLLRWSLFALLPLVLIAAAVWYVTGGGVMSTEDAYVNAEKGGLSTDVSGIVSEAAATENQHVSAGQVLYRLDPRQFQI